MNREMIDPYIADQLTDYQIRSGLRVPRQSWSERHALAVLALALLGFWALTILAVSLLVKH